MDNDPTSRDRLWPTLPLHSWSDTLTTLHMWTQIVGKVRLALTPYMNHWWEVPLYVTASGLTTSPIPYDSGIFEISFDFIDHKLDIATSNGQHRTVSLYHRTVAGFYREFMELLHSLHIQVKIWPVPVEIQNPIRFDLDVTHRTYDPACASRFWRILATLDPIFKEFRGRFIGKASPVHFFWGSFDLAVTRFSGRPAPERPDADKITKEAYSHEVSSVGWWPGGGEVRSPMFYSYAAPEPSGFQDHRIAPATAFYSAQMKEYFLSYDNVRSAPDPKTTLLDFCQSTYEAAAIAGKWDRESLEHHVSTS
ncbi:MAG: DUF5996 family protein [Candidatus Acidiferrales bacterium]